MLRRKENVAIPVAILAVACFAVSAIAHPPLNPPTDCDVSCVEWECYYSPGLNVCTEYGNKQAHDGVCCFDCDGGSRRPAGGQVTVSICGPTEYACGGSGDCPNDPSAFRQCANPPGCVPLPNLNLMECHTQDGATDVIGA